MYCPECGSEVTKEASFCPSCGAQVSVNEDTVGSNQVEQPKKPESSSTNPKKNRAMVGGIAILVLLISTFLVYFFFLREDEETNVEAEPLTEESFYGYWSSTSDEAAVYIDEEFLAFEIEESIDYSTFLAFQLDDSIAEAEVEIIPSEWEENGTVAETEERGLEITIDEEDILHVEDFNGNSREYTSISEEEYVEQGGTYLREASEQVVANYRERLAQEDVDEEVGGEFDQAEELIWGHFRHDYDNHDYYLAEILSFVEIEEVESVQSELLPEEITREELEGEGVIGLFYRDHVFPEDSETGGVVSPGFIYSVDYEPQDSSLRVEWSAALDNQVNVEELVILSEDLLALSEDSTVEYERVNEGINLFDAAEEGEEEPEEEIQMITMDDVWGTYYDVVDESTDEYELISLDNNLENWPGSEEYMGVYFVTGQYLHESGELELRRRQTYYISDIRLGEGDNQVLFDLVVAENQSNQFTVELEFINEEQFYTSEGGLYIQDGYDPS